MLSWVASSILLFSQCARHHPIGTYQVPLATTAPDYHNMAYWAAHPQKKDPSDRVPKGLTRMPADTQATDVFFLYPTSLIGNKRNHARWNADVNDGKLNDDTDNSSILFQASIFNAAGQVYAPRYRQAHLQAFYGKDTTSARLALQLAYTDVLAAFDYYLKYENKGRPFILAAHSQGTVHARQLIRDRIENTSLQQQMVVAYLVGYPIPKTYFKAVQPCTTPDQTGCYCTWRTWERAYALRKGNQPDVVCTNPLVWTTQSGQYAPKNLNKGGVVKPFEAVRPAITDAEVNRGFLLARKPKFPGSFLLRRKNYHIGDLNLYYVNVRENAVQRARIWQAKQRRN